jgi:NADH-quinone oxidoreductase subunit G
LVDLGAQIDAGKIKVVVTLGEDLAAAGLNAGQLAKISVIVLGTHANSMAGGAAVVFPTLTAFEKSGTFVNQQFRIQKFLKAVPPIAGATDDLIVLAKLVGAAGGAMLPTEVYALWKSIAAAVPALATTTFANLPETGQLLDATPFSALPFVEGETLHYKPAQPVVAAANA